MCYNTRGYYQERVTPLAGVWIEMVSDKAKRTGRKSLPSRECGLKSENREKGGRRQWSLPSRECGLKYNPYALVEGNAAVTPLAGVWIEITSKRRRASRKLVTPLAGVWIEINIPGSSFSNSAVSLPSRECGLKSLSFRFPRVRHRHSPRGSVD